MNGNQGTLGRRGFLQTVAMTAGYLTVSGSLGQAEDKFLTRAKFGSFEMYYEVHGEGPAIAFAHGGGGSHLSWWRQVPVFSQNYKCITFDHRTFAYSKDVPDGPGRSAHVEDLKSLLDHLKIQKAAVVGQSMGGSTVLGFASKYPDRVSALVMCDTTGSIDDREITQAMARYRESRPSPPRTPGVIPGAISDGFIKRDPAHAFLYREITALTVRTEADLAAAATPSQAGYDIQPILAKKVPILIIVGEEDTLVSPAVIEMMHKKIPGSRFAKIPNAGHSAYFENPSEFNRVVLQFLKEHAR